MERDVHQSISTDCVDWREATYRLRIERTVANDTQAARPLGNKHGAVRKKRQTPWVGQSPDQHRHSYSLTLRRVENNRLVWQWRHGNAWGRHRLITVEGNSPLRARGGRECECEHENKSQSHVYRPLRSYLTSPIERVH
jgi:hypothetical protein